MDRYDVPGVAIALVQGGAPVWSGAYGWADVEQGRPMTVNGVFRAESISKAVTAWGVMGLVEQGRIDLDDPVQLYLGGFRLPASRYSEQEVTVRRLLSHSAGMPLGPVGPVVQYAPGSDMPSLQEYLALEAGLVGEPGAGYRYSNVGFNLLELVIEEVTGRDFAEYMADEVLLPLGMRNSSFAWSEALGQRMATGYDLGGGAVPTYVYPVRASGGLFTTADDIARFAAAGMARFGHTNHGVLREDAVRMLWSRQVGVSGIYGLVADAYGFGHFIQDLSIGGHLVWVGGQGNGWMTDFHMVPETGDAIVILTNSQRSWPLMAHVLGDWSRWAGFGPVKWVRIAHGVTALWAVVGLIVLISLGQLWRLVRGFRRDARRWAPLAPEFRSRRLVLAVAAVGVIAILAWASAQPYLMISSVFPGVASWAGIAFLGLAMVGLLSALCPRFSHPSPSSGAVRPESLPPRLAGRRSGGS